MVRSSVAAGGIASVSYFFHVLSDLGKRSSLWLSQLVNSSFVPLAFQLRTTLSFDTPLMWSPLHSAVWTFLGVPSGTPRESASLAHPIVYHAVAIKLPMVYW